MRAPVLAAWHRFSEPLEGRVPFLYLDSAEPRAFVTVGVGNLCPLSLALTLPFARPGGYAATREEITQAWRAVEARQDLAKHGGMVFSHITDLRLSSDAIDTLVSIKLAEVDRTLAGMFPEWEEWPACAQLALCSWAWSVGAHAKYPRMFDALRAGDFDAAANEVTVNPQRGTIITRNARNRTLLRNADRVRDYHLDPDMLEWVDELGDISPAADTLPNLPSEDSGRVVYAMPETVAEAQRRDE